MVPNDTLVTADSTLVFPCHWDFTVATRYTEGPGFNWMSPAGKIANNVMFFHDDGGDFVFTLLSCF